MSLARRRTPNLGPFTWANRPSAAAFANYDFICTDLNYAKFYSDGVNWRPCGQQDIVNRVGLLAQPLATLSGVASGLFAIPAVKIPASLIIPNGRLVASAMVRKTNANAIATLTVRLGTAGTTSDSNIHAGNMPITTLTDVAAAAEVSFYDATRAITKNYYGVGVGTKSTTADASVYSDITANINTASDMYVTVGIAGAAADSFALLNLKVSYEV